MLHDMYGLFKFAPLQKLCLDILKPIKEAVIDILPDISFTNLEHTQREPNPLILL